MEKPRHRRLLFGLHRGVVVRVAEAQRLDHMAKRPFREPAVVRPDLRLKDQGARSGPFHRPPDPEPGARRAVKRGPPEAPVAQDAVTGPPARDAKRRVKAQFLEGPDARGVGARVARHVLKLHAVVEGEDPHRRPVAVPVRRPVNLFQRDILAQRRVHDPARQEELQFVPAWIGGRAAVAADGESAAGVGIGQCARPGLSVQPALEQPRHEAVARPENVEDLDREAGAAFALVQPVGDRAGKGDRPHRPALAHQRRAAQLPHGAQRGDGVGRAAGNVKFLLGADDQVEKPQCRLKLRRDRRAFDEAVFPVAMPRKPPEVRPVVDVERGLRAVFAGQPQRLQDRRRGAGMRQMRAGRHDRPRRGDEAFVDVILAQGHVGAVFPVEDQRKLLVVADPQKDQRRQPFGVGLHPPHVDALARQLLADEAAHVFVADAGDERGLQPQPRGPRRDVGGAAANVFLEGGHVFEPAANLAAVEVDRCAPDGDHVKCLHHPPLGAATQRRHRE